MIVVDASVLAPALGEDGDGGRRMRAPLAGEEELFAPEIIDLEVTSVVRRAVRAGRMETQRAIQALGDLVYLPISRVSHQPLLARIWDHHANLTAYDAAYVALAETLGAPLLTADARLARAPGLECEVMLLS